MLAVPLFDLKFLAEFAASAVGTSNRRHCLRRDPLRESAALQNSCRRSARRSVVALGLAVVTSASSVLPTGGNPSCAFSTRCSGRIATSERMVTPRPADTAACTPARLGLL